MRSKLPLSFNKLPWRDEKQLRFATFTWKTAVRSASLNFHLAGDVGKRWLGSLSSMLLVKSRGDGRFWSKCLGCGLKSGDESCWLSSAAWHVSSMLHCRKVMCWMPDYTGIAYCSCGLCGQILVLPCASGKLGEVWRSLPDATVDFTIEREVLSHGGVDILELEHKFKLLIFDSDDWLIPYPLCHYLSRF